MKYLFCLLSVLSIILLVSCKETVDPPEQVIDDDDPPVEFSGEFIERTECKNEIQSGDTPAEFDKLEYFYQDDGTLILKHINAGLNCCPGKMNIDFKLEDGKITIDETKIDGDCRCLCLFDLDYKLTGIPLGKYKITILGQCLNLDDEPLTIEIDLNESLSGDVSISRNHFPWDEATDFSWDMIEIGGCGKDDNKIQSDYSQECFDWNFQDGTLILNHTNAGGNCCPNNIANDITMKEDTIYIDESNLAGDCDCECLYDFKYELRGLINKAYYFKFISYMRFHEDEALDSDINLETSKEGKICKDRTGYPWH